MTTADGPIYDTWATASTDLFCYDLYRGTMLSIVSMPFVRGPKKMFCGSTRGRCGRCDGIDRSPLKTSANHQE